eukprot:GHVT01034522.1.p1 GENE.GHVT01034522.1~~GHVT01034522.1.p1  ORF type:complete len:359 (+),score=39.41 GHVT01034522.1:1459-2535(+)
MSGFGFEQLEHNLKHFVDIKEPTWIYVTGRVNSGKSTFVNRFLHFIGYKHLGTLHMKRGIGGVTRSALPGTTLGFVPFGLPKGFKLVDTPGIPSQAQVSCLLREPLDGESVVLSRKLRPIVVAVPQGSSLLLGALARIDVVASPSALPPRITCFTADGVTIHICSTDVAAQQLQRLGGVRLWPPHLSSDQVPTKTRHIIKIGPGVGQAAADDVVIAGLGWISVICERAVEVAVWAPAGVSIFRRPALLPCTSLPNATKQDMDKRGRGFDVLRKRRALLARRPKVNSDRPQMHSRQVFQHKVQTNTNNRTRPATEEKEEQETDEIWEEESWEDGEIWDDEDEPQAEESGSKIPSHGANN